MQSMVDVSDARPAPSAVGTLAERPLVHLLVYARNRRLTGRLEIRGGEAGRSGSIELWRGRIRDARTNPPMAYFGAVAYEQGLIDTATLDATLLELAKTKRLHGEILVERGAINRDQRDAVLLEQTCRKIHHLDTMPPDATFAFYDAQPAADEPPLAIDPIGPAWRALRDKPPTASVSEVLSRFKTTTLRMANEGPLSRAGFDADETALCDALTWKPMTVAQMRVASQLPASRVDLLVYFLVITKCVEVHVDVPAAPAPPAPESRPSQPSIRAARASSGSLPAAPPSSRGSMPAAPPSSRPSIPAIRQSSGSMPAIRQSSGSMPAVRPPGSPQYPSMSFRVPTWPEARAAASGGSSPRIAAVQPATFSPADLGAAGIAHRAQVIGTEDLFSVLGLPDGASDEAVRAAYFRLAKLWHPDRLGDDLELFRGEVQSIFTRMSEAHVTLTDADARRAYLATRSSGAPVVKAIPKKTRLEIIREIESTLAKRLFKVAEAASRELVAENKDDHEAIAIAAWASTFAGESSEETLRAAVPLLDKVVNNDRDCARAFYYRGMLHKRLGNLSGAFRDFSRCAQLEPKHLEAQREIRIFEMRARKGSGEHALDSLIKSKRK